MQQASPSLSLSTWIIRVVLFGGIAIWVLAFIFFILPYYRSPNQAQGKIVFFDSKSDPVRTILIDECVTQGSALRFVEPLEVVLRNKKTLESVYLGRASDGAYRFHPNWYFDVIHLNSYATSAQQLAWALPKTVDISSCEYVEGDLRSTGYFSSSPSPLPGRRSSGPSFKDWFTSGLVHAKCSLPESEGFVTIDVVFKDCLGTTRRLNQ